MPRIDWDAVEENDFSPIPEGEYTAIIETARDTKKDSNEILKTRNGDDMWALTLKVTGPTHANRKVFTNLIFNEGGYGNIKKLYSAIFGTKLPKKCDVTDIEGEEVGIDVIITEYNGKQQNSIPYAGFFALDKDEEEFA